MKTIQSAKILLDHVRAGGGAGVQAEADERGADHLPAHPAHPLHRVHHQLFQGLLLRGGGHRQSDCSPRPYHAVHQCVR